MWYVGKFSAQTACDRGQMLTMASNIRRYPILLGLSAGISSFFTFLLIL